MVRERQETIVGLDRQVADLQGALKARDTEIRRMHEELAALQAELRSREVLCHALTFALRSIVVQ